MKTKRIFSIIAATALAITAGAQQSAHDNYVGVNFGGGLNSMLYKPANGTQKIGAGFDAGIHYARFFNSWAGLGVGLQYNWANAYATYNWNEVTTGLTHQSNPYTPYNLTTSFNNFVECQNVGYLSIPVEALFRKAFNDRVALIGGVGLALDLPIYGKYIEKGGSYSTTGVFPEIGKTVFSDMPEHGFSTYTTTQNAKFNNRTKAGASVIADLGVRFAFNDNWGLYVGVNFGYGFTNLLAGAMTDEMLIINETDPSKIDYRGTFDSNETAKANLLRCGVKIAIDFGWPSMGQKNAEAERLAREAFVADSIAAAQAEQLRLAREKAIADSIAVAEAEAARIAAEKAAQEALAAAEAERLARLSAEDQARLDREKAIADSIAAAEAEHARKMQEAIEHFNALKAKGEALTVHFDLGADQLKFKNGEQEIIDEVCMVLSERHDIRIVVIGHTDNTGNAEQNLRYFGKKRAEALKAYMVSRGANADQIECESRGQEEPVADNSTREGRALNRRANIKFL